MATSPLPPRGPKGGRKRDVTLAFSGVPQQGDKIKSGYIVQKDKTVGMQPKRILPKIFRTNGVLSSKNTLKKPPTDHF